MGHFNINSGAKLDNRVSDKDKWTVNKRCLESSLQLFMIYM